jgi:penicillin-insensitive murein DD-endopeptidase
VRGTGDGRLGPWVRHEVVSARRPASPENARLRRSVSRIGTCGLALVCCALGTAPGAALDDAHPARVPAVRSSPSVSSGLPWDGRLEGAVRLRRNAILRPIARYSRSRNFYGTSELVGMLERTAQTIAARWPGSRMAIGELSAASGGKVDGHHSHRSGRDADVAFFMRDGRGRASLFWRFVSFDAQGIAQGTKRTLFFDDMRNWAMVAAMLRDPQARVQYVFVSGALRTRLLMEGRRQAASDEFLRTAAAVLVEPKHDNHFHVRIYCARDDRPECQDSEPYWPWYDGAPPAGRFAELPIIRWRTPSLVMPPQPARQAQRASSDPRSI